MFPMENLVMVTDWMSCFFLSEIALIQPHWLTGRKTPTFLLLSERLDTELIALRQKVGMG